MKRNEVSPGRFLAVDVNAGRSRVSLLIERTAKQLGCFVLSTAVFFIPLWIFLWVYSTLAPASFWEKLAMLGIGALIGGGIQVFLLFGWIASIIFILSEIGPDVPRRRR